MNEISFFKNSVNTDIYVGQGAGKKLLHEIRNANKSVKIISPFLSPVYVEQLIELKNRGIEVQLVTSDEIEDYKDVSKGSVLPKLILQERHTDEKRQVNRNKKIKLNKWLLTSWIVTTVILIASFIHLENIKLLYGLVIPFVLFIIYISLATSIRGTRIFTYSYKELFPFKVFLSPYKHRINTQTAYYIHSKIYIIDEQIAYLGSVNFSKGGLELNFESRIRTTDSATIKGLSELFNEIFYNDDNYYLITKSLGKSLYKEPIN